MRVGLTYNLRPETAQAPNCSDRPGESVAEWDDEETIEAVRDALSERHEVVLVDAREEAFDRLREFQPDMVFNIAEGEFGPCREGHIPSILEYLSIPYTASDPLTLNLCLDKARAKEILAFHGLPTAPFRVVGEKDLSFNTLRYPLMVKPLHEGSSIGIHNNSVVATKREMQERISWVLDTYKEPALVEEFLAGREFTIAILGNGKDARVLPIVELRFDSLPKGVNPIYSYEAKWIWDTHSNPLEIFACPADLTPQLQEEIERVCLEAYRILRCRDWCRIDVRLDADDRPHIIELNPLPGILPQVDHNSCFPKAARAVGMSYSQLINAVLDIARQRYEMV